LLEMSKLPRISHFAPTFFGKHHLEGKTYMVMCMRAYVALVFVVRY